MLRYMIAQEEFIVSTDAFSWVVNALSCKC
jgi:hypothetical protein